MPANLYRLDPLNPFCQDVAYNWFVETCGQGAADEYYATVKAVVARAGPIAVAVNAIDNADGDLQMTLLWNLASGRGGSWKRKWRRWGEGARLLQR